MFAGLDVTGFLWLAGALLAAGAVTGFLAGLLGIGGGGVLVPILFETFTALHVPDAIRMHMVLGTSFAVIVPTAIQSYRSHRARGSVDEETLRRLMPYVLGGVSLGFALVSVIPSAGLKWVWIVCSALLSLKILFARSDWRLADDVPDNWIVRVAAFSIGLLSMLMSIGGGMFLVSMFTLCGWSILRSVGTSSGFGPLIAIPGVLGYMWAGWGAEGLPPFSLGYVSLIGVALIVPMSVLFAPLGVRVAHGISRRSLELVFGLFLALVSLRLLWSAL